jgi:hypothetical protein
MENSNSLTNSILQSSEPSIPSATISPTASSGDSSGFFDSLKSINLTTWLLIILILAFLGFNIFVYLAKGTQDITSFFGPFLQKIFGTAVATTGQVVDVSAQGAKAVVGGTANAVETGLSGVQSITPGGLNSTSVQSSIPQPNPVANTSLNRALNTSKQSQQQTSNNNSDYQASEAPSSINAGGKAGWCYIGEDRGFRTCAQVGVNDQCMSGDIFPTNEICINPNLRP